MQFAPRELVIETVRTAAPALLAGDRTRNLSHARPNLARGTDVARIEMAMSGRRVRVHTLLERSICGRWRPVGAGAGEQYASRGANEPPYDLAGTGEQQRIVGVQAHNVPPYAVRAQIVGHEGD